MSPEKQQFFRKFAKPVPKREISIVVGKGYLKQRLINIVREEIMSKFQPGLILETGEAILKWKD